ncbi:hypothetical protein ACOCJ4_03225 [Knoellia sp. CPCC 206435]|uniref:hypothetical protein n=1 Tax=Knoellia terrae TaxID=3404797 RepID=UPI003B42D49F
MEPRATPLERGNRSASGIVTALLVRALPWVLCASLLAVTLVTHGTTVGDLLRYAVYLAVGVALPGTLLVLLLLPGRRPPLEHLALGTVLGLATQLPVIMLLVLAGHPAWLRAWPAAVVLVVLLVPPLRRRCRTAATTVDWSQRAPVWWHWGVATSVALLGAKVLRSFLSAPVPPDDGVYYVDLPWHLALVHAVTRGAPLEVPQVAGTVVEYHWFADGDMAAASVMSGVPEAVVLLRLWPLVMVVLGMLLVVRLARVLSGGWGAGLVAAWVFTVSGGLRLPPAAFPESPIVPFSPSHVYVVVMAVGAMILVVHGLRGASLHLGGWLVLVLLLAAAGGGKPAALPTIACGAALTAGAGLVLRRLRPHVRPALKVLLACAALLPVTATLFSGSDSQSSVHPLAFMTWHELYREIHRRTGDPLDRSVLDAIDSLGPRVLSQLVLMLLLGLVLTHLGLALGAASFVHEKVRRDPVAWFVAGALGSSFAAYALVSHQAYSQVYFVRLALAYGAAVLAWVLVGAARRARAERSARVLLVVAGALLGALLARATEGAVPVLDRSERASIEAWRSAYLLSCAVFVGGLGVVALLFHLASRRRPALRGSAAAVVAGAVVLGAPAYAVRDTAFQHAVYAVNGTRVAPVQQPRTANDIPLPSGGAAAMHWLNLNTPRDAVVATNRHCSRGTPDSGCVSNLYMVSGLGGRQTVLESWAYVSVSGGPTGNNPYPELLAANDALFTDPSPEGFARMKRVHGLGWLVADSTATPISPRLAAFATPRFSAGTVTVYEVR